MARSDFSTRALLRGGGIVGVASLVNALVVVAVSTIVARNLGTTAFGSYAFAMAVVGLLTILGQMGLGPIVVRELSKKATSGSPTLAVAGLITTSSGLLAAGLLLVTAATSSWLPPGIDSTGVIFIALLVVASSLMTIASEVFRGLKRLAYASMIGQPMYRAIYLAMIFVVPLESSERTAVRYLGLAVAAALAALLVAVVALFIYRRELDWSRPELSMIRRLAVAGAPITTSKAADEAAARTPVWVLALLDQVDAAGIYALAATMVKSLLLIQSIGWQTLSPFFARYWHESGASAWIETRIRGVATVSALAAGLASLLLLAAMRLVLPAIVGDDYAAAVPTAAVLAIGTVIAVATGQCGMVLNLTGNQRSAAVASFAGLATGAVLVTTGSIAVGVVGAAAGAAAGTVTTNALQALFAYRTTTINTTASLSIMSGAVRKVLARS